MRYKFLLAATAALSLSACGGGGTNSTPTPTPSPTPTPTPTPAVSSSFTALSGDTNFSSLAAVLQFTGNTQGSGFAISYTASSKSYTLTRGSSAQTFGLGDVRSMSPSNGLSGLANEITFYDKSTASTQDLLFLTKAGGAGQTKYVSGGAWVHGSDATDAAFHLFSYGFATADAAIPRIGAASFDIRFVGNAEIYSDMRVLLGEGNVTTDFATGSLELNGLLRSVDVDNNTLSGAMLVSGYTTISSTTNGFSGTLHSGYDGGALSGQFNGRFYGPSAEETGGAFSLVDNRYFFGVGEFIGSRDTLAPYFTNNSSGSVRNLGIAREFDTQARTFQSFGNPTDGSFRLGSVDRLDVRMAYSPASGYLLSVDALPSGFSNQILQTPPSRPDLEVYPVGADNVLVIENPQVSGAPINMTYASFASWTTPAYAADHKSISLIYGELTAPSQMPKAGQAAYSGPLLGTAEKGGYGFDLTGTSTFNVNFANGGVTGGANVTGTPSALPGMPALPSFSASLDFVDGRILSGTPTWSGSIKSVGQHVGTIDARFYGPAAAEMAGFWDASIVQGGDTINMTGSVFTKKQ